MTSCKTVDDETSTSSADETHEESSTSTEEEEETTASTEDRNNKEKDDTDIEVDDLPVEKVSPLVVTELGDRSSPDGFEWPDCPVTPPLKRCFSPLYRRPPSPYDNVPLSVTEPAVVHTSWGLDALRSLDSSVAAVVSAASTSAKEEQEESDEMDESSEEEEEEEEKGKNKEQGQTLSQ